MNPSDSERATTSHPDSHPLNENDHDRLDIKHIPGNQREDELKSLQERLEEYKKNPAGMPWESAFERLLNPTSKIGSDIC